jgi:hypothetical protein
VRLAEAGLTRSAEGRRISLAPLTEVPAEVPLARDAAVDAPVADGRSADEALVR